MKVQQIHLGWAPAKSAMALIAAATLFAAQPEPGHAQTRQLTTPYLSQIDSYVIGKRICNQSIQHEQEVKDRAWATAKALTAPLLKDADEARARGDMSGRLDHIANQMTNVMYGIVLEEIAQLGTQRERLSPEVHKHFCGTGKN